MNRIKIKYLVSKLLFLAPAILLVAGCKTIVRENIISSIDTGVGATVAENKQTQLYELKAGYIRSQFYSIPTGKLVENPNAADDTSITSAPGGGTSNAKVSNAANVTPQVVSGIKEHSGLGDLLLGMDVSENFAVGEVAVMSPAAVAMYVADAKTPQAANAASTAAASLPYNTSENIKARASLDDLLKKKLNNGSAVCGGKTFTSTEEYADCLANGIAPGKTLGYIRLVGGKDLDTLISQLQKAVEP
jgi:hypothetical protein